MIRLIIDPSFPHIIIQEQQHKSDVVNSLAVVLFPELYGCVQQNIAGPLNVPFLVEWGHDFDHLLFAQELPDAVACDDDYFVFLTQDELSHLGDGDDTHFGRHLVSEAAGHGEAWGVFVFKPYSHRADLFA